MQQLPAWPEGTAAFLLMRQMAHCSTCDNVSSAWSRPFNWSENVSRVNLNKIFLRYNLRTTWLPLLWGYWLLTPVQKWMFIWKLHSQKRTLTPQVLQYTSKWCSDRFFLATSVSWRILVYSFTQAYHYSWHDDRKLNVVIWLSLIASCM